jgi:hypothetical protein
MRSWAHAADDVLRRAEWTTQPDNSVRALVRLLLCLIFFGVFYGAVMGTFRGLAGQSQWLEQIVYSAVKVPLLLTVSFILSLPSFFVLSSLLGLRRDFAQAVRSLVAAQTGLAITLTALSPLTLLWYASSTDYAEALLFNGVMFAIASLAAQMLLRGYYRPLIRRNPRHRILLACWGGVYVSVAIQLAWLLRPFIGSLGNEVQFLRPEAWDNAYVVVFRLIWQLLVQ